MEINLISSSLFLPAFVKLYRNHTCLIRALKKKLSTAISES